MSRTKPQMTYDLHHWKEKPKMIQPKGDGPDPVAWAIVFMLLAMAIGLVVYAFQQDEGVPHSLRSGSGYSGVAIAPSGLPDQALRIPHAK